MELVYLWVEEYKNIHKQGFNFSPRFECKFHDEYDNEGKLKDNCKLEIIEKKEDEYIKDFFGDNINVTAIVGKNGSGKSSVLEFLNNIKSLKNIKYLCIYQEFDKVQYISNIDINTNIVKSSEFCQNNFLFYKNNNNSFADFRVYPIGGESFINLNRITSIFIKIRKIQSTLANLDISENIFIPTKVKIKLKSNKQLRDEVFSLFLGQKEKEKAITYYSELKSIIGRLMFLDFIKHNYISDKDIDEIFNFIKYILLDNNCYYRYVYPCKKNIKINKFSKINQYRHRLDREKIVKYIFNMEETYQLSDLTDEQIKIYFNTNDIFQHNKTFLLFDVEFFDSLDRNFKSLSDGEQIFLAIKLYILNNIGIVNRHNYMDMNEFVFLFDEIETALHPLWQKQLIEELISVIKKYKTKNDKIHLVFTTHSPFLLSDIPKQNIIFLDKDADGKCIVVDGLKEKKQTFGANIHTLLSDSFFMEDGLMGEFAKGKIDKVITLLNQEKLDEKELKYCEQIISIIGEPIVKNQLQRMLDSKRLKKVDEIDAIKQSMEAMQKRLDELEK